jgi:hypothetical protein
MGAHATRPARRLTGLLVVLVAAIVLLVTLPVTARADNPCEGALEHCGGTSNGASYSGVVIFPGWQSGGGASGGGGVSQCVGCEWTYTPHCLPNGPDPGADAMCNAAATGCEARGEDGILMRVYFRRPGQDWQNVGTACIGGDNDPVTLADLAADAGQVYRDELKPNAASISPQPANGPWVVNFRSYFMATGAGPRSGTFGPAGARMTISATPTYVWNWGDGSAPLETTSTGGPYPTGDVTHVYRGKGARTVTLTTRWSATFTVDTALGTFGPFEVPGPPVAPSSTRAIRVQEGRAELIDPA